MSKRGDELHEQILFAAKDVFLELGFERASMDEVAKRAETSKRTLYAHFESKERLYLAVIALVKDLYLAKLKSPEDYATGMIEALVLFCGRFLELLLWAPAIQMSRMAIAEAERFPQGSSNFHDAVFTTAEDRIAGFLVERGKLKPRLAKTKAYALLAALLYPSFTRALFGIDKVSEAWPDEEKLNPALDLGVIRKAVASLNLTVNTSR
jgi:AcrR family transcriptional regulator